MMPATKAPTAYIVCPALLLANDHFAFAPSPGSAADRYNLSPVQTSLCDSRPSNDLSHRSFSYLAVRFPGRAAFSVVPRRIGTK